MERYLDLFIGELEEYVKQLNKQLLHLESDESDQSAIIEVFRIFHTIKGMTQTMGYDSLTSMTHSIEDILGDAKSKGSVSPQFVDFLFTVADHLSRSAQALKKRGDLPSADYIRDAIAQIKAGKKMQYVAGETRAESADVIRIRLEKLDTLFNLTNELTIIKARLLKLSQEMDDPRLVGLSENASRLMTSLQDEVMRLRMLPLLTVFDIFPRWFRDEAKRQNKPVSLQIVGGDIEVDRSITDILKEPLLHLVRNAIDHAIEPGGSKEKRHFRILLSAERERDRIKISVTDDGKGIDVDEVRRIALEKGVVTEQEMEHFTEDDFYRLLTRPGFSTKREVSTLSGRGIGLDVVNNALVKLGGKLSIVSKPNIGSRFTLELPLSLAVLRAMVFSLDGQRYALPLTYITETFFMENKQVKTVYHRELFPLRNDILPLVKLSGHLGCQASTTRKAVIVVQYEGKRRGFITDEILDEEEIVVKKLDPLMTSPYYSGCSVYSDGLPILILDPRGFE
jgi:two-component system chemotaxis sensor kinase CheA